MASGTAAIGNTASQENGWRADVSSLLRVWRAGSILRMRMLDRLADALDAAGADGAVSDLFLVPEIVGEVLAARPAWRRGVAAAVSGGSPAPVLVAGLAQAAGVDDLLPAALRLAQQATEFLVEFFQQRFGETFLTDSDDHA